MHTAEKWTLNHPIGTLVKLRTRGTTHRIASAAFHPPHPRILVLLDDGSSVEIDAVELMPSEDLRHEGLNPLNSGFVNQPDKHDCNLNHPQYIKANFDHYNADDTTPRIKKEINGVIARSEKKWKATGLAPTHTRTGMTTFPDAENNIWFSGNRTPLVDGYVSESMDGKRVAPLMGDYQDADVGTLRIRTLPNFWNHSSCDHAVSTRLLPVGPQLTAIRVWWLVDAKAVEGRDYQLEKLMPFWQMTSEQDWEICERQQRGVNSSAFTPGPYSTLKEYNVDGFVRWYLKMLAS